MPRGIYECIDCGHREVKDSNDAVLGGACPECGGDMVLVGFELESKEIGGEETNTELYTKLREFYDLGEMKVEGRVTAFEVLSIKEQDFERVLRELEKLKYWAALKRRKDKVILYVFPAQPIKKDNPFIGISLFIATVISTFLAGYWLSSSYVAFLNEYNLPGIRNIYLNALAFSISVLAILGTHEMGHKIAATIHGVKSTFPYFIPFPNLLGTLGAVIRVKSPIPTRNAAIDLGVSGPIAGFLVAIPVSIIGLKLSVALPASMISHIGEGIYFGENLLFMIIEKAFFGNGDLVIQLHPVAIAGWVGILVTFLNLIPAAQLDGGHVARAFMGEKLHYYFTMGIGLSLLILSAFWPVWVLWAFIILILGRAGNPGALDEVSPIGKRQILLALIVIVIFVLSATPIPIKTSIS